MREIIFNTITELYKGHYLLRLNDDEYIKPNQFIDKRYKFVWLPQYHDEEFYTWTRSETRLFGKKTSEKDNVLIRKMQSDVLVETNKYIESYMGIKNYTYHVIQTNIIPPHYVDVENLKGAGRYNLLLEKADYLYELNGPDCDCDFDTLVSPDKDYLTRVLIAYKFKTPLNAFVYTDQYVLKGHPITIVKHDLNGEWQFLSGKATTEEEYRIELLNEIIASDDTLMELSTLEKGSSVTKDVVTNLWQED